MTFSVFYKGIWIFDTSFNDLANEIATMICILLKKDKLEDINFSDIFIIEKSLIHPN